MVSRIAAFSLAAALLWPAGPLVAQDSLALDLQRELSRVGCLAGEPDGRWGPASGAALADFAAAVEEPLGTEPSAEALDLLRATYGTVCDAGAGSNPAAPETAAAPAVDPPAPPEPAALCRLVRVEVGAKPGYGMAWDFPRRDPDIVISESTTGMSNMCENSYACSLRLVPVADGLDFRIVDDDGLSADDPIGQGQCPLEGTCSLPPAAVLSIEPC